MKSRIKRLLFGSVTRELFFIILGCVCILLFLDMHIISRITSDGIYVFASDLLHSIIRSIPYIIKSAVIPCVIVKLLNENRIRKLLFKNIIIKLLSIFSLFLISITFIPNYITMLILIFLSISIKANYIKNICSGIKTISQGNLDYKIKIKGHDELAILSKEINNMSLKLKNKIEEERAAEKLKNELITNVSHDLRTPLTALIGYIQLAADDTLSFEDKDKYTKISLEKSKKLKALIDDLFEYSKLQSGGIKLKKVKVNIIEIIEQSIGELSIKSKEKCIGFNKNFKNSRVELLVDPNKIARVFENILENAVKYSANGTSVTINLYENDTNIIISFENISENISQEHLEKIFNRFYRTDASRNSEIGGSGLGLSIAKSIVSLHNGAIWAESKDNRFIINLKLSTLNV